MKIEVPFNNKKVSIDLAKGIDISIAIDPNSGVNAFHIPTAKFEPIRVGSFVGSVKEGGSANCENLYINAHGNGTHTECIGHISEERVCIHDCLKQFFFFAQLVSVTPKEFNGDFIIDIESINNYQKQMECEAIIIRTLPNHTNKLTTNYSGINPTYLSPELCEYLREIGIKHLLIDLPSVDREEDEGALAAHKAYWDFEGAFRKDMTITELVYVPTEVEDGTYFLNLQIASLMTDASPSKPLLFNMLIC
ncbi:MAG: cyclase family protein [Sphingobacteriales bacterium]|nr:cyclase family protein [Sphingobacteriales bacterium]